MSALLLPIYACSNSFICVYYQYGLSMTLKSKDGLILLARSIDPNYPGMMTDVVKLIAAVCLVE